MSDDPVRLPLSHGQHALVDAADLPLLALFHWHAENIDGRWFAARRERGGSGGSRWRLIMMHRQLLAARPGTLVVHVNGDSLDNQRSNLREATRREVGMQRRPNRNTASGYKGVTQERRTGRWRAVLTVAGAKVPLGYYPTAAEAARVYDAKAAAVYGELARLNFPSSAVAVAATSGAVDRRGEREESGTEDANHDPIVGL